MTTEPVTTELTYRIKNHYNVTELDDRAKRIVAHYDDRIPKGMSLNIAFMLAVENIERRPWHRYSKHRKRNELTRERLAALIKLDKLPGMSLLDLE